MERSLQRWNLSHVAAIIVHGKNVTDMHGYAALPHGSTLSPCVHLIPKRSGSYQSLCQDIVACHGIFSSSPSAPVDYYIVADQNNAWQKSRIGARCFRPLHGAVFECDSGRDAAWLARPSRQAKARAYREAVIVCAINVQALLCGSIALFPRRPRRASLQRHTSTSHVARARQVLELLAQAKTEVLALQEASVAASDILGVTVRYRKIRTGSRKSGWKHLSMVSSRSREISSTT